MGVLFQHLLLGLEADPDPVLDEVAGHIAKQTKNILGSKA